MKSFARFVIKNWKPISHKILKRNDNTNNLENEYWYSWEYILKKRAMVFRNSSAYGYGALIPTMMQCCEYAYERGFEPYIEYDNIENLVKNPNEWNDNHWDVVFEQIPLTELKTKYSIFVGGIDYKYTNPRIVNKIFIEPLETYYRDIDCCRDWRRYFNNANKYFKKWFRFSDEFQSMIDNEWSNMFSQNDRILGVFLREEFSIDRELFEEEDPIHKHPYVLKVDDVIKYIKELGLLESYNKIYLATMFSDTVDLFIDNFGIDNVKYSQRERMDWDEYMTKMIKRSVCIYREKKYTEREFFSIEKVKGNDVESNVSYMKDLVFCSKSNGFLGQRCGGTRTTLIINGGSYDYYSMIPDQKIES